jgi:hypothetical protein
MRTSAPATRFVRLLIPVALCAAVLGASVSGAAPGSGLASTIGVYPGFDRGDRFAAHENLLGSTIPWAVHMLDKDSAGQMRSSAWGQLERPGAYLPQVSERTNLVMTVPLAFGIGMVDSEADRLRVTEYLSDSADGRWDDDYRVVARMLIENGFGDAVIRLGHEFDGVYVPWSARGNESAYVEAFRHVHDVFASESADFRFEWTGMRSTFSRFGPQAYPGDEYVDIVGMDIYYRQPEALTADVWASQYLAELEFHRDFAIAHGKPVGYSEWGVAFFDEPAFIDAMRAWFTSLPADGPGQLVYQSYFNSPRDGYDLNDNPKTRTRYQQLFGEQERARPCSSNDCIGAGTTTVVRTAPG